MSTNKSAMYAGTEQAELMEEVLVAFDKAMAHWDKLHAKYGNVMVHQALDYRKQKEQQKRNEIWSSYMTEDEKVLKI